MKKNYFSTWKMALVAVLSLVCLTASAGESSNKWYYVAAKAYPSGSGTVYVSSTQTDYPNAREYKDVSEAFYHDNTGLYNGFIFEAKPAEGKKFIGWASVNTDDNGNETISEIITNENPKNFYVTAKTDTGDDDGSTGVEPYPLFPDTTFAAVFGLVDYQYAPGQNGYTPLGNIKITNPTAGIGETMTFEAIPTDSTTTTFVQWTDAKGKVYTDNPVTITVDGPNTMIPFFRSTNSLEFDFPEDGGIMITVTDKELLIGDAFECGVAKAFGIYEGSFAKDSLGNRTNNYISNNPTDDGYQYQRHRHEGILLWGKGKFNIAVDDNADYCVKDTLTYCKYDTLTYNVKDLPAEGYKYYVLAEDHKFYQVTEGLVDNSRWVLAVPDSVGENRLVLDLILEAAGETAEKRFPILNPFDITEFLLAEPDETAVDAIVADEPKSLQRIFDLGGRIVAAPGKRIAVKEGKKVIMK